MESLFYDITIIVSLAAFLAIIFRLIKQPPILAYILAGIIISKIGLASAGTAETIHTLSDIGIVLLLFMLGLELKIDDLKSVGKVAIIAGIGQIIFTSFFGYLLSFTLGFNPIASLYIAIALTFSSTIIIVKLLSDKKHLKSLYGRISVGFLLVQDFVAIFALIILSGFNTVDGYSISLFDFLFVLLKGLLIFALVIYLSKSFFPAVFRKIPHSSETLFLFSLAWAFAISYLVSSPLIGFSIEIGGFLAGIAIANSAESFQIVAKIKSLRDFFITIFFVNLGATLTFGNIAGIWLPALIFSLFVLIGNPLIVLIIMGLLGYKKRTSFLAGLTVAQISEFSLIIIVLGNKIGHLPDEVVSLITIVGVLTFTLSTYMILNGNTLYRKLSNYLSVFERKKSKNKELVTTKDGIDSVENHVILVGIDQMGESILEALEEIGRDVVVIDFDLKALGKLSEKRAHGLYGDIADLEIQQKAKIDSASLVISTIPELQDNLTLLKELQQENRKAKIVAMALDAKDARALYKAGADYVVLPYLIGGKQIAKILAGDNFLEELGELKEKDKKYLS